MASVFQLLVAAVIAVALLYTFSGQFTDFFSVKEDLVPKLNTLLTAAKSVPGQTSSAGEIGFFGQSGFSSGTFSDARTDAAFECNSPVFCCGQGEDCSDKVRWSSQTVFINAPKKVPVYGRCIERFDFFACKFFFGVKPGQLEFGGFEYPSIIDLSANRFVSIAVEVRNSGELASSPGNVELFVSKIQPDGSNLELTAKKQAVPVDAINPNEFFRLRFDSIGLDSPGIYALVVRAQSDNAGYVEKKLSVTVIGAPPSNCRADSSREPFAVWNSGTSECVTRYFCSGCDLATNCKDAWHAQTPLADFELGDFSFAQIAEFSNQAECR